MRLFFGLRPALWCAVANAAALVPVPAPPQPTLPVPGLEPNKGQASAAVLFLSRGNGASMAVTSQSVLYSPLGAALNLVASNPNPTVSFSDPLPGLVNSYSGADSHQWVTGIPRYATVTLSAVFPGIDARYTIGADGTPTLNLSLAAGVDPKTIQFQIPQSASMIVANDGSLMASIGSGKLAPKLVYPAPVASQGSGSSPASRSAGFAVQSATVFGLVVQGVDSTQPLQISLQLNGATSVPVSVTTQKASDAAGDRYFAATIADAAGRNAPFPQIGGVGCGNSTGTPVPCLDLAIYKYSAANVLEFITYLGGQNSETTGFLGLAPDGGVVAAGTTNSADFPVTAAAFQMIYGGPAATPSTNFSSSTAGDFFAAILDPATGLLRSSTYLGGPNADVMGTAAMGADGSLYFLPVFTGTNTAGMPVTSGALQPACQGDPCQNSYVARLSPALDKLIFGTYLPGISQATAQLYSDGSVYYAGTAQAGFPTSATAYQAQNAGGFDGIIARLDPDGQRLLAATYFGGPNTDWILGIAVAPDGSIWATVSSFLACCINIQPQLIHLDASLSRLAADLPIYADQMVVSTGGNLFALAEGNIAVSPGAVLGGSCGGPAYIEVSPAGQQLFATYLPGGFQIALDGGDAQGTPYLDTPSGRAQVAQDQPAVPSAGCVVDAPSFTNTHAISPGAIVTIFGSGLGPAQGVGFQLLNGQVPVSLGGTQVLINGEPAPILYSSYGQLNLILPYSLAVGSTPTIQVVVNGTPLNPLSTSTVQAAGISLFQANGSAVALNQDFSVNSPQNPARPGSTVMLFGSGGGQTNPPNAAGQVTPLELRPLVNAPQVSIASIPPPGTNPGPTLLQVQYAGAAPALVSGVTQINVVVPAAIPAVTGYPLGTLPFFVTDTGTSTFSGAVTISVSGN